jgi:glycosyltransferase involved in cell wall biosynthesis
MSAVAIAHDYLNQRGGGERVVLEIARQWPDAPIHTTLYRRDSTFAAFAERDVRTSWLDRLPIDRRFRAALPLYPSAIASLGALDAELVVSSSSGWAHAVRARPGATHVCYCHTPARWLWDPAAYSPSALRRAALSPLTAALRRWDLAAARRPTAYVANSERTRAAIARIYGRHARVIPPPVGVERFTPRPRGERLLVVSRLLAYKRVDLAVEAATRAGIGLDVVGDGPLLGDLRDRAGPSVRFHGRVDDATVTELLEGCRALVLPGVEDFGIVPVEANAAGKPVVAFGAGGVCETQVAGVTAAYFHEPSAEALLDAVRGADGLAAEPAALRAHAERFAPATFRRRLADEVARVVAAARPAGVARSGRPPRVAGAGARTP